MVVRLSPGVAQGCFELLEIIGRSQLTIPVFSESFPQLGSISGSDIFAAAQGLGWIRINSAGLIVVAQPGERVLGCATYQEKLRQVLLDYIEVERPAWVQNASFGRMRVISFAGTGVAQVIAEADLADGDSDDVVQFWDEMAGLARGQKNLRLNQIGRRGEKLTIAYEVRRTNRKPRWVAIDNAEDGYDVLSIVSADDVRKLTIEVKASTQGMSGSFYLTRNEWARAQETTFHVFHLWDLLCAQSPQIAVLSVDEISCHIPSNNRLGEWTNVEIPFGAFKGKFSAIVELSLPVA